MWSTAIDHEIYYHRKGMNFRFGADLPRIDWTLLIKLWSSNWIDQGRRKHCSNNSSPWQAGRHFDPLFVLLNEDQELQRSNKGSLRLAPGSILLTQNTSSHDNLNWFVVTITSHGRASCCRQTAFMLWELSQTPVCGYCGMWWHSLS